MTACGSRGVTLLLEAPALSVCQDLAVRQAARMIRVRGKQLWRRIDRYLGQARRTQDMSKVAFAGIDMTSLRKDHQYVTVEHDLANDALDKVRSAERKRASARVSGELGDSSPQERHCILWAIQRNRASWNATHSRAVH